MAERVISNEDMQKIKFATSLTKADIIDCIEDDDTIIFVVSKGFLGRAIGKNARNIDKLRDVFKKNIRFVELDNDEKRFIANLFKPFEIEEIVIESVGNRNVAKLKVPSKDKTRVIGRNGKNVRVAKIIAQRHSSIEDIQIQ